MLGNTLVLPHVDGNITCIKINQDKYSSEYLFRSSVCENRVRIRHSVTKPSTTEPSYERHNVEVTRRVFATADTAEYRRKTYFVIEQLPGDTDVKDVDALCDLAIASANAFLVSLLNWES